MSECTHNCSTCSSNCASREKGQKNPDLILVTNELGYGVVPVDRFDREYREKTGRVCCEIAKQATEVHRVICGIGTVIKHG